MWFQVLGLAVLVGFTSADLAHVPESEAAMVDDDECAGSDSDCAVNALQKKAIRASQTETPAPEIAESDSKAQQGEKDSPVVPPTKDEASGGVAGGDVVAYKEVDLASGYGGWSWGGSKVWGHGTGTESIHEGNVDYYNAGMSTARGRCGHSGCALCINPIHHRSVNKIHIHEIHYKGWGASLKAKMERVVCGNPGWHHGHFPCGGKAAFFPGWPGVFTEALYENEDLSHVSVIAWPEACGGGGTIVELAYSCSIEHQIRGDFNPHYHR